VVIIAIAAWQFTRPAPTAAGGQAAQVILSMPTGNHVMAPSPVAAGRYLVQIAGCNDCHTPGWQQTPGKIPESDWLTGVPVGWRGPWGTTYASNLRVLVQTVSEDGWVQMAHTRNARPPMPWSSLNDMSDHDLRSIYQYIKSLGSKGEPMPPVLAPGQTPKTPYLNMLPKMP
jgi:hypothetical protein